MARLWLIAFALLVAGIAPALAHDHNRPELNDWFHSLHGGKDGNGNWCCDGRDIETGAAVHVATEDWDVKDGHYRVHLNGRWITVEDSAVVQRPNLYGQTLVWPVKGADGEVWIRCFLPGAGG